MTTIDIKAISNIYWLRYLSNHFTPVQISVIMEALDAYPRFTSAGKQRNYEANRLYQAFSLALKQASQNK